MRLTLAIALISVCLGALGVTTPSPAAVPWPELYVGLGHSKPISVETPYPEKQTLTWSPDSRTLTTGSEDGSLRLWDAASGRERAVFYSLDGGKEWLVTTPAGYFAASAHGAKVIQWRQGGKLWPAARFRRRLQRPDLVRRALS